MISNPFKVREIRAKFDSETITVYQAYNIAIANSAIKHQTFVSPFKVERMTWVKPSFLWMMYRSGWAKKENQERVLAIKIKREGFEWALKHACLSHFNAEIHTNIDVWKTKLKHAPVRIQWDPEKDILLNALPYRSIQIGLHQEAVEKYINEWIVEIKDITEYCHNIADLINSNQLDKAKTLLPQENIYSVPDELKSNILMEL